MDRFCCIHKPHDRKSSGASAVAHDLAHADCHGIDVGMLVIRGDLRAFMLQVIIRQERLALLNRLIIIRVLPMRKCLDKTEHMDDAGHILVDQTDQFEVADSWECYGKLLPLGQRCGGEACCTIETASYA